MCHPRVPSTVLTGHSTTRRNQHAMLSLMAAREVPSWHSSAARASGGAKGARGWCLCSPTVHPGSFRCRYHRSKYVFVRKI
ncbi:hypothetical protein ACJRO7_024897 [Eucalyptus globulus]|uniref:Uncharacterized protein n=1 Tax=Eucalyptus globulus TaxID=34317 RepID=A0ABD3K950_EUCGL